MKTQVLITVLLISGTALAVDPSVNLLLDGSAPSVGDYQITTSEPSGPGSPSFPNLELITGGTWDVWSVDTDNPDDIGDIGEITIQSGNSGNFVVKLKKPNNGDDGAREVKGLDLTPDDVDDYSTISVGKISILSGDLVVQADDSATPVGGVLDLEITGNATGDITAQTVNGLTIGGTYDGAMRIIDDIAGDMTINNFVDAGVAQDISIEGDVHDGVTVTLDGFGTDAVARFGDAFTDKIKGDFVFNNGIPADAAVKLLGRCIDNQVDFKNNNLYGSFTFHGGGNGSLVNLLDQEPGSKIDLSLEGSNTFNGSIAMVSMEGTLQWDECGSMDGRIIMSGSLDGCLSETLCATGGSVSTGTIQAVGMGTDGNLSITRDTWEVDLNGVTDSGLIKITGTINGQIGIGATGFASEFAGRLELGTLGDSSEVDVRDVTSDGEIEVTNFTTGGGTKALFRIWEQFDGNLKLVNGVPSGYTVTLNVTVRRTTPDLAFCDIEIFAQLSMRLSGMPMTGYEIGDV
jgi:hypothetical protein